MSNISVVIFGEGGVDNIMVTSSEYKIIVMLVASIVVAGTGDVVGVSDGGFVARSDDATDGLCEGQMVCAYGEKVGLYDGVLDGLSEGVIVG